VVVIGGPLGLEKTAPDGIVSAVRDIPNFGKIIQITAPISPGSSGSPVINMKGEVVGVATFRVVEGQNLNFAIPGERVARLKSGEGEALAEWVAGRAKGRWASAEEMYSNGLALVWAGEYQRALSCFGKVIEKNPRYPKAYFYAAFCNMELGHTDAAIKAIKEAVRIEPDDAVTQFFIGAAYLKAGEPGNAIQSFQQAIRINPDFAEAHCKLGSAYAVLERKQEALEAFQEAIRVNPDYTDAHYFLGRVYVELGDISSALQEYRALKSLNEETANKLLNSIYK